MPIDTVHVQRQRERLQNQFRKFYVRNATKGIGAQLRVVQAVMQKDLINRLAEFGFTVNQAKVYLSIIQSGRTDVGQISKSTLLHRQDIYKLLPKLEKMGLITRAIDKPVTVEALPIEKALERLIAKEKEAADRRITCLEKSLEELAQEIKQQPKTAEDTRFTLLTTHVALRNRLNVTLKIKRDVFRVVNTTENLKGQAGHFYKQYFQMLADSGTKTHLILVGAENPVDLKRLVEKLAPRGGFLLARAIEWCPSRDYQVVEGAEVWIATQQKTPEGYPAILWTNDLNIVESYLENFNQTWINAEEVPLLENQDGIIEAIRVVST